MINVEVITNNIPKLPDEIAVKRVATYCRVSTLQEIQFNSLETQMDFFENMIAERVNWKFVGIYADQASGRNNLKMKEFQRMMADCRAGKIDLVLVKSISRLGRNTVQFLNSCSELNALGIDVYFVLEKIHVSDPQAVRLMTIYASLFQNESEEKSANVKWGLMHGFTTGTSGLADRVCYGYRHNDAGKLVPYQPEADVVKRIFEMRNRGASLRRISTALESDGVPAPRGGKQWGIETIRKILQNEKYRGDVILQKTYVSEYFTGKQAANNGERNRYLIEGHHEGIVGKR